MGVPWRSFADEAPALAGVIESRFAAHLHHVIGTIRADGAPRLSGTEVHVADGQLRIGMMPDAHKLADVLRDPRVEVHSAPIEVDLASGDAKVAGRLRPSGSPPGGQPGSMFDLDIERVSLVRVDGDELEFTTWRPGRGVRTIRRS
jgi:hypothetical protein